MSIPSNPDEKQKQFYKRLEKITARNFVLFLEVKNVTTICPMCQADGKQTIAETHKSNLGDLLNVGNGHAYVTFFRHDPAHPGDHDNNYYYKLTCEDCGYITTHGVSPVLKWFESFPENAEDLDHE